MRRLGKHSSFGAVSGKMDYLVALAAVSLLVVGVIAVYDVSVFRAFTLFGDKYYFFKNQVLWGALGLVGMAVMSKIDYHYYARLAPVLLFGSLALLALVLIPGVGTTVYGAQRWINFGSVLTIQPSEIYKLTLIVYLSSWLGGQLARPIIFFSEFVTFGALMALSVGLVMMEPDFGTTFIMVASAFVVYFVSGAALKQFLYFSPLVLGGAVAFIKFEPYRLNRLKSFLDPTIDPQGISYHINQILLALGSGGLFGVGLGQSRQKFEYIPEVNTDSIFAVIAEELGFVGSLLLIGLFVFLGYRSLKIAQKAPDKYGRLLAIGITSVIAIQALVNLGSMVALFPLTGVTLPFISYGGSSLVITLVSIGVLLNISSQRRKA